MSEATAQKPQQSQPSQQPFDDEDYAPAPPTRWQRWKRRLIVLAVILLIVAGAGEFFVSRAIESQLRKLVERKLDAKLEIGSLMYVPPYGAWAWNVRLVRNSNELIRLDKIDVSLGELPIKGPDAPIVISSIGVDKPVLNMVPGAFDNMSKAETRDAFPRKLSEMLRLNRLRISDGRIAYYGAVPNQPPTTWENLSLDANLSQRSPARYNFQIKSRAAPMADASLAGSIDVDELLLELQSMTVNVEAQPEPKRTPLPASVQKFITDHRITGDMVINGTATIPLREPNKGSCLVTLALKDGSALIPHEGELLEHARASIVCHKTPNGVVQIRFDTVDIAGTGRQFFIDGGTLELDPAAGTFRLAGVAGHIQLPPPTTSPSVAEPSAAAASATTKPANVMDELSPSGRIDFTAFAEGPIDLEGKKPWEAIRHEFIAYPRNLSFHLKDFARRFEKVEGGEVRLVNGTVIFQELRGRYGDDEIRVRGARLPLTSLPEIERWREISAAVIFNPPAARYTPKLDRLIEQVNPSGAFLIAGNYTFDRTAPGEPRQDYDLILSSDTGSVTVTSRRITLSKIRGDATLTPAGVEIHGVEAEVLGGKLRANGSFKTTPGDAPDTYAGDLTVSDLDLAKLTAQLSDAPTTKPASGRAYVESTFSGHLQGSDADANLKALQANGQYEILGGSLYQFPVLRHVTQQIKGLKQATTLGDAAATFEISGGDLKLTRVAVNSTVLGLQGYGTVNLLDGKINGDVVAAPLADWQEKFNQMRIPLIGDIAGGVQKMLNTATGSLLYAFRVTGTLKDVKVAAVPAPVLTDTAATVFGHMLKPMKDERPLDWLKLKLQGKPHEKQQAKPAE